MKMKIFHNFESPEFKFSHPYYHKKTGSLLGKRGIRSLKTSLEERLEIFFCFEEELKVKFTKEDDKALNTIEKWPVLDVETLISTLRMDIWRLIER